MSILLSCYLAIYVYLTLVACDNDVSLEAKSYNVAAERVIYRLPIHLGSRSLA